MMDHLKEAFSKVKEDINSLNREINILKSNLEENKVQVSQFSEILNKINEKLDNLGKKYEKDISTNRQTDNPAQNYDFQTPSTHSSTRNTLFKPLKPQNMPFSTGNEGVSTNRQTDNPTNKQTINPTFQSYQTNLNQDKNSIKDALEFLNSLDSIKKEIRLKFKRITEQEFLVFSTIYQMDEEYGGTDYKSLSKRLKLSESSIRDYVGRLLKKEIPIDKIKINNKNVQLSISRNLKKIVSLPTILQLREI